MRIAYRPSVFRLKRTEPTQLHPGLAGSPALASNPGLNLGNPDATSLILKGVRHCASPEDEVTAKETTRISFVE